MSLGTLFGLSRRAVRRPMFFRHAGTCGTPGSAGRCGTRPSAGYDPSRRKAASAGQ